MQRLWSLRPQDPEQARQLAAALSVSPLAAQLLINRGVTTLADAKSWLHPDLNALHSPMAFASMRVAVERVRVAIADAEPILVFGDYDVDGTAATALLVRCIRAAGGVVSGYVPSRLTDGYGIRTHHVAQAAAKGVRLIITVDNGICALEAGETAHQLGVGMIITDHHEPARGPNNAIVLPTADAIVNPQLDSEGYPFKGLCGAGIAFKLAWALTEASAPHGTITTAQRQNLISCLGLVALATVADVVPLTDENHVLVSFGLRALAQTSLPGLAALMRLAKIKNNLTAETIAFQLAPRLNAVGRLGQSDLALRLLSSESAVEAADLARQVEAANQERKRLDAHVLAQASAASDEGWAGRELEPGLVLAHANWHPGVLGIVCSRLVDRFQCPVVLLTVDGVRARGSARGVAGLSLPRAFARCGDLLTRFGGHAQAAGLELPTANLDVFRKRFSEALQEQIDETGALKAPAIPLDADVELSALSPAFVNELMALGPYGKGFEAPVFRSRGLSLTASPRAVGTDGQHLQLQVQRGRTKRRAIGFGLGSQAAALSSVPAHGLALAYQPCISTFRGRPEVELQVLDLRPHAVTSLEPVGAPRGS